MDYLIKPTKSNNYSMVISKLSKLDIKEAINNSEVLFSDIDDTIAPTYSKRIVIENFFNLDLTEKLDFAQWITRRLPGYLLHQKKVHTKLWFDYVDRFLEDKEIKINEKQLENRLYPGVKETFSLIPKQVRKVLVSRNIKEVVDAYKMILSFDDSYYLMKNKASVIGMYKDKSKFVAIGDSREDGDMLDPLKEFASCLGIWVASSKKEINEKYDVNISRNWKGLESILGS
ncbi:hypothetical protein HYX19_03330 [Candidatus Woesearchaeota archaeon]|nr:hypothetical protein [Candidatus Woesearchaeota archaeon]